MHGKASVKQHLHYVIHPTCFGLCLLVKSERGVCALDLRDTPEEIEQSLHALMAKRSDSLFVQEGALATLVERIFSEGQACLKDVTLDLQGTPFQQAVWEALLAIPKGVTVSYSEIAHTIGHPKAVRAVGSAVGDNPVGYLVPCHRVLRKDGGMGGYATGVHRKQAMLRDEKVLFAA